MRFFKNIITFVFVTGALVYTGYSFYFYSLSACDKPFEYGIGQFDTEFGVSKEAFRAQIATAEKIWEKELGRDIFLYNPDAKFKINLVYDERQLSTIQKQKTEFGLSAAESVLAKLDGEFKIMKAGYDSQVRAHQEATIVFESKQKSYESKVDYWNRQGGAPKNEYESLQNEARVLSREASELNRETSVLNVEAKELNALLDRRNQAASEYNKVAQSYNQKYGHGVEFNQAEYTGSEINVYQFGSKKDLSVALTHELGHALGMNHVENQKSIMYYITGGNSEVDLVPSAEDLMELKRVCPDV